MPPRFFVGFGLLTASTSALARGTGGWGWLVVGAPFILLAFSVIGGSFKPKGDGRRDDSGSILIFIVALFIGIPFAMLSAEFFAEIAGVQKKNGVWILFFIELACFVPYALWKERQEKSGTPGKSGEK